MAMNTYFDLKKNVSISNYLSIVSAECIIPYFQYAISLFGTII